MATTGLWKVNFNIFQTKFANPKILQKIWQYYLNPTFIPQTI